MLLATRISMKSLRISILFVFLVHSSIGNSNIDCYFETLQNNNNIRHNSSEFKINTNLLVCKLGYARLPDNIFKDEIDDHQFGNSDQEKTVFCCPVDIGPEERRNYSILLIIYFINTSIYSRVPIRQFSKHFVQLIFEAKNLEQIRLY